MADGYQECCGNCNAWQRIEDGKPLGKCRAHPPVPILLGMQPSPIQGQAPRPISDSFLRITPDTEWCREHEPSKAVRIDFSKLRDPEGNA